MINISYLMRFENVVVYCMIASIVLIGYIGFFVITPEDILVLNQPDNYNASDISAEGVEEEFYKDYRDYRLRNGLPTVERSESVEEIAEYHSNDMAENSYFSHTAPNGETVGDRFELFQSSCSGYGENIAKNYLNKDVNVPWSATTKTYTTEEGIAEALLKQYINSPPHKELMDDPDVDKHGIDVAITEDKQVYHTHNFCFN